MARCLRNSKSWESADVDDSEGAIDGGERAVTSRADGLLLAIESSCDETAAAVIDRRLTVLSNVVSSQHELHQRFGGVVPEIASRADVRRIIPAIDAALREAGVKLDQLAAVAVTTRPGLVGSLLVGLTAAKTLALCLDIPLVDVNHVEAHLFACRMTAQRDIFPAIGLVVSGGHTLLYDCVSSTEFNLLGSTIDDAAGEAFDKGTNSSASATPVGPPSKRRPAPAMRLRPLPPPPPRQPRPRLQFQRSEDGAALRNQRHVSWKGRAAGIAARTRQQFSRLLPGGDRRRPGHQSRRASDPKRAPRPLRRRRRRLQLPPSGATKDGRRGTFHRTDLSRPVALH